MMTNIQTTVDIYFPNLRREGGNITDFGEAVEERKQVHNEIFQRYFGPRSTARISESPVAVLFMGGPASGKSSIREEYPDLGNFVVLDSDDVKGMLPEYQTLLANGDTRAAAIVHDESSFITQILREYAIEHRYNILIDGVGANYSRYAALVESLMESGYTVQIVVVDVVHEVALMRSRMRKRQVPLSELHKAYFCDRIRENAKRILRAYNIDGVVFNSHETPPAVVWLRGGNEVTLADAEYAELFWEGHCPEKWRVN